MLPNAPPYRIHQSRSLCLCPSNPVHHYVGKVTSGYLKRNRGRVALPRDERLWDELVAIRWKTNSAGKIQLEPKDLLRQRLGRSPDRADAVAMAFGAELTDTCTVGGFHYTI